MALERQLVPVTFQEGVETKVASRLLQLGKLREAYDVWQAKTGQIKKRNGNAALLDNILGGTTIANAKWAGKYQDELLQIAGTGDGTLYSYSPTDLTWVAKGSIPLVSQKQKTIIQNIKGKMDPDCAAVGNIVVYAWADGVNAIHAQVVDRDSGAVLIADTELSTSGVRPRCFTTGGYLFVAWADITNQYGVNNSIKAVRLDPATPSAFEASFDITTTAYGNGEFDITDSDGSAAGFVYTYADAVNLKATFGFLKADKTIGNGANGYPAPVTYDFGTYIGPPVKGLSSLNLLAHPTTHDLWMIASGPVSSTTVVMARAFADLSEVLAPTTSTAFDAPFGLTAVWESTTSIRYFVLTPSEYWNTGSAMSSTDVNMTTVRTNTVSTAGVFGTLAALKQGCCMASTPFRYNSATYIWLTFTGWMTSAQTVQPTHFLVKSDGTLVGKWFQGSAAWKTVKSSYLPYANIRQRYPSVLVNGGEHSTPLLVQSDLTPEFVDLIPPANGVGLVDCAADFSVLPKAQDVELFENLFVHSGLLYQYDGQKIVENGFHLFPDFIYPEAVDGTGARHLVVTTTQQGTAVLPEIRTVAAVPGYRIKTGQYLQLYNGAGSSRKCVFRVDGERLDSTSYSVVIDVNSSDTIAEVGTAMASAIDAHADFIATGTTTVTITNAANGVCPDSTEGTACSGSVGIGTYYYVGCYEWVDSKGNVYRSAPSRAAAAAPTSAGYSVGIVAPALQFTLKDNPVRCYFVVYRTENAGNIFYRVNAFEIRSRNNPAELYVYVNDDMSDATLVTQPILYTQGGILENIAAPYTNCMASYRNRLVLGGVLEDDTEVWVSKEFVRGDGVGFNDTLTLRTDNFGGGVKSLAAMDDKILMFKRTSAVYTAGDGPDDLGSGSYPTPQFVSKDVGCDEPNSITAISGQTGPEGLIFKSLKGWCLCDRALGITPIGAQIEDMNDQTVAKALYLPDIYQVRVLHTSGNMAVFDYYHRQWYRWRNMAGVGAVVWNDVYHWLASTGIFSYENPGHYLDGAAAISGYFKTAWLQLAQLQGFERIRRIIATGRFIYPFHHVLNFFFDHDESVSGTPVSFQPASGTTVNQFEVHMPVQKCRSMCLEFSDETYDASGSPTATDGYWEMDGMTFEVGVKKGTGKLAATQSTGSDGRP